MYKSGLEGKVKRKGSIYGLWVNFAGGNETICFKCNLVPNIVLAQILLNKATRFLV